MVLVVARDWLIFTAAVLKGDATLTPARNMAETLADWCDDVPPTRPSTKGPD